MGLSLALNTARTSLAAASNQIAVASRNIAGASDASYSRKVATLITGGGAVRVVVARAGDAALFARKLDATAASASRAALLDGLKALSQTVGDTSEATSPAARLGALNAALQAAANQPDTADLLRNAVDAARDLAGSLNAAAEAVHRVRRDADAAIAASVARINDLLTRYESANRAVIKGVANGSDVSDGLDDRDRIVAQLSEEVGLTTVEREGGDLALYTDGGVPLFERTARPVSFAATAAFAPGTAGSAVTIDGVPVTGGASPMRLASGRVAGLASLRDDLAPQYEAQLDAIAGALVDAFAEADRTAPAGPRRPGLFTLGAALPSPGSAAPGYAARIRINPAVDPRQGGDLGLLRDGGMNGAAYRDDTTGDTAYSGRLRALVTALGAEQAFDPGPDLRGSATLPAFAAASAGWLEGLRKGASAQAEYQRTLLGRATEALSNVAGVNGDDETAQTLQLERSYTASAKLLTLVDDLLRTLLEAVR
ncbi:MULTISPECIES: flagellar hook-associated protein FlgK [Methylobacterium]|uniref:flagellar hook-associated protein FlgK n=1 Tax=Methylobacterium TaxID=407 RepID=UPI00104CC0D7|nr:MULTISPECIES: flagellar hook-associated protein FlgK [Methylobacterium]MDR7040027.1 flagellar hook-associated protein 1 FlgK [Methylobacterium sp. BE186]